MNNMTVEEIYRSNAPRAPRAPRALREMEEAREVSRRETHVNATVGRFYRMKYRDFTGEGSYYAAAKNLKKQGVPLGIALLILTGRA